MKTTKYILTIALALVCTWSNLFAVDQSYYTSVDGKSGKNLFDAVHTVAKTGYKSLSYNGLWTAYCAIDLNSSGKVWDMYSNATSYTCGGSAQGANYTKEGDSYNREHSIPKSWFGSSENSNTPGTDLFHVVPTDGYVNNMRSSYAYGEVASATYTSQSGCKKGSPKSISISNSILNKSGSSSQSCSASTVFEPMDEFKGDFARGYFGTMIRWANGDYQTFTTAPGNLIFNTAYTADKYYGLTAYGVALLLKWHREDPVSQKEIDRNNGIQSKQGNRNPFIDYPELVEYIWGEHSDETVTLASLTPTFEGYTPPAATTYTVLLSRNGETEAVSGLTGTYNLPASSDAACEGWTFAGWSATKVTNTTSTPSFVSSVTGGCTVYAVYSKTTSSAPIRKAGSATYNKVTSTAGITNGQYLIVYETGSVAFDGSRETLDGTNNGVSVTITSSTITGDFAAKEFTINTSGGTILSASGKYIGNTSNSNGLTSSTTALTNTLTINSDGAADIISSGGAYLRYNATSGQDRFRYFKSSSYTGQKAIQLYKKDSGGGGGSTTYDSEPEECKCSGNLGKPAVTAMPSDRTITLTWQDVNEATNGYTVTISKGSGYTTECGETAIGEITHSGTTNTCIITGLINGLTYTTSVVANATAAICESDADEDDATPIGCSDWDVAFSYDTYTIATGDAALDPAIDGTTYGAVHFISSNPSVLSVDEDGKVTAVSAGTATITVHWDGNETYCPKEMVSSQFTVTGTLMVTYDKNDGTLTPDTKTQEVDYNEPVTLDGNTFTRTGYTFQGWATTRDGGKVYNDKQSDILFTETTTLYAVWQINSHQVTFEPSITGATVTVNSSSTSPQNANYNSTVTVTVNPAIHYSLSEITISTGGIVTVDGNNGTFTMPDEDVTVSVVMTEETKYTVTWDVAGTPHAEQNYAGEALVGIADPTSGDCDGSKVFVGWTGHADYEDETNEPDDLFTDLTGKVMPVGGTTYYAVFADEDDSGSGGNMVEYDGSGIMALEAIDGVSQNGVSTYNTAPYLLKFDDTGDYIQFALDAIPSSLSFDYKMVGGSNTSTMTIKECATINGTYTNVEAFTISGAQNSTGTKTTSNSFSQKYIRMVFTKGSNVGVGAITITGAGTSYSNYATSCVIPENVTVIFDANGGTGSMANQTIPYNTATALTANSFSREGYSFQGWATTASGAKAYDNQEAVTFKKKTTTLYAVWQKKNYTIILDELAHGTIETSPTNTAEYEAIVTVTVTPGYGYLFGSITVTNNSTSATIATSGSGNVQSFTMPASDVTITATVTEIPTYTVTWSMDGDESHTDKYIEGDEIVFPTTASGCEGKTFMGWSAVPVPEQDEAPAYTTSATMETSNLTFFAVYAEEEESGSPVWSLVETLDEITNGTYVIVNDGYALPSTTTSSAPVKNSTYLLTIADKQITSTVAADMQWSFTMSAGHVATIQNASGKYLYANSDNNGVRVGSTSDTWTFKLNTSAPNFALQEAKNSRYCASYNSDWRSYTTADHINYADGGRIHLYKYSTGASYFGYTTTCGASIIAKNIGWITAAKGQKVKRVIDVTAKNFDDPTTLSVSCANSHFAVTLGATAVPAGTTGLTTTLTVEYTPTEDNTREENVEIVLTAGDKTRTITVHGRSVPEEFLLITKKSSTWYALPSNMGSKDEHDGVEVTANDPTTPTAVAIAPSTIVYSLASNASDRYADYGHCVRLVGNDNLCLWSNMAETTGKTHIQNKTGVSMASSVNHDWLLTTTDGIHYTIANPNHPHYNDGRRLAFGTKFGMYIESTEFFIVETGCSSLPDNVNVRARRTDATFAWISNASDMLIDVYTDEGMTALAQSVTATSQPYIMSGLNEQTNYWFRLTPDGQAACSVTGNFQTTGPTVDVVEWGNDVVTLFVDKDEELTPTVVIAGEKEYGIGSGNTATNLFFSKYFEAEGNAKMLAIFNGTKEPISLADVYILQRASSYQSPLCLAPYGKTPGSIQPNEEIILFNRDERDAVMQCATSDPTYPTWFNVENSNLSFSGKGTVRLFRGGKCIDIIGAMSSYAEEGDIDNYEATPKEGDTKPTWGDDKGFVVTTGDNYATKNIEEDNYGLSTNRCLLIRKSFVTSGDSAVLNNYGDFKTLGTYTGVDSKEHKGEWAGLQIATATGSEVAYIHTCEGFQETGKFDYSDYYKELDIIDDSKTLDEYTHDPASKTYEIPIENLAQYSCLQLVFQLKSGNEVVTEVPVQVPIIVKDGHTTVDAIFNSIVKTDEGDPVYDQSINRCKTCDVVVLGSGVLTKEADGTINDAPEVGNVKVYPGGKLIVPAGTNYTVQSLSIRRQEDEVGLVDIQGTVNFKDPVSAPSRRAASGVSSTYFDLRIDPTNWHYISLPYDCKVSDICFANPEETGVPVLGTDYLLKWYNGEKRAATQSGGCWEMVDPDATLKKGLGYIFSIPGEGNIMREFRFPMDNAVVEEETGDKLVSGVYGYGSDKDMTEVRANHRGWNLLGNPYLMPYTSDITDPLMTGSIVPDYTNNDPWDGHYMFNPEPATNLHYIVEPIDNGWAGYRQVAIADYPMTPFTCYFVQIGADDPLNPNPETIQGVEFHNAKVDRSPIRRAPAEYEDVEDTHPVWCAVTLTNPKGEKDETTLLISNRFTDGYDMMNDLIKWRGSYYQYTQITTAPVLASRNNEGEMAFNALPDASALAGIPLNYFAASQGFYTIAYDDKYDKAEEVQEVKLWDKTTNQWYDLMNEPYSFTTNRTDNTDRFILSIRVERKQPQTPTGIEPVGREGADGTRKILINGHVYIQRGAEIYDIVGKQLLNH